MASRIYTAYRLPHSPDQHQHATSLTSFPTTLLTAFSIPASVTWLFFHHTRHAFALKPLPSLVALPGMLFPSSMCWKYQGWLTFKSLFTIIFIRSAMTILYSQSSLHSSVFNSAFLLLIYFVLCFLSVSFHWYVRLMKKKSFVCFVHWYISSTSSI